MILFKERTALKKHIDNCKNKGATIGFVPTMGALHKGHISLVSLSKKQNNITLCSIFVNPTQFNNPKDFEKYPVTIATDIEVLEKAGCDILFLPSVSEMYPEGMQDLKHYELGNLENLLEGEHRPGHFQGVCQVMERLLKIVEPSKLYLGQKDFQQVLVIKKLVELLQLPIKVITAETTRENSGLAMSSRNLRLSEDEKIKAIAIFNVLNNIKNNISAKPLNQLLKDGNNYLLQNGFTKVDYVAIVNALTLQPAKEYKNGIPLVALVAAFMGEVRLIDNMIV